MLAKLSVSSVQVLGITVWVLAAFIGAQILGSLILIGANAVVPSIASLNEAVLSTIAAALGYGLALLVAVGVPYTLFKRKTTLKTLGIQRLLSWSDIGLSIVAFVPYALLTAFVTWLFSNVLNVIDLNQTQDIPFNNLVIQYEFVVAFITLVILAPLAEELLFRGYFLGKMSESINKWASVVITALVFGLLHVPGFNDGGQLQLQWGVAADTFSLGIILGLLRVMTKSIWAGVLLHMIKNGIAYYILFIDSSITGTM